MLRQFRQEILIAICVITWVANISVVDAGTLTVTIKGAPRLKLVGVIQRWDQDGNPTRPVDPKAKIDAPMCIPGQARGEGVWYFDKLARGRYDIVILGEDRLRIDGFDFPPVLEFDPFFSGKEEVSEEQREEIEQQIRGARYYENKVEPLYYGGNDQVVRVLVMLIRDLPTSYEADFPGAATIRHEIWQYTWAYGGWKKERRTRVIDRCILHRDELRRWTWLWDPRLGGIEVKDLPISIEYRFPDIEGRELKGLYPY